jgi:putative membrane protein
MMWWSDYGPGPWMYFGPVFFILMMGACAFMMFFMMRGRHRGGGAASQILRERFARGEIDKAEYEERRRLLDA